MNSNATLFPFLTVREVPSIMPPDGFIHCSDTVRPLANDPSQQPPSHSSELM